MTDSVTTRAAHDTLPTELERRLRSQLAGGGSATVENWRACEGGFSTETFLFDVVGVEGRSTAWPLAFRRPPEVPLFPDYDLLRQFRVMGALKHTAIPVAAPVLLDRGGGNLGTPYFLMEQVSSIGTVSSMPSYHEAGIYAETDEAGRQRMWGGLIDTMARIHRLDWRELGLDWMTTSPHNPLEPMVAYIERVLPCAHPSHGPVLAEAVKFLRREMYQPEHITLCWGDARLSNLLFDPDLHPAAVLDWETAFIGDHGADLAWALFLDWASSTHQGVARAPGSPERDELIESYQRASGWEVTNLRYNEVLAATFLAIPLLRLAVRFAIDDPAVMVAFCNTRLEELL